MSSGLERVVSEGLGWLLEEDEETCEAAWSVMRARRAAATAGGSDQVLELLLLVVS
jgi:hypothetical protein